MDYKLSNRSYGKTIEQRNSEITEFLIRVFSNLIEKEKQDQDLIQEQDMQLHQ